VCVVVGVDVDYTGNVDSDVAVHGYVADDGYTDEGDDDDDGVDGDVDYGIVV